MRRAVGEADSAFLSDLGTWGAWVVAIGVVVLATAIFLGSPLTLREHAARAWGGATSRPARAWVLVLRLLALLVIVLLAIFALDALLKVLVAVALGLLVAYGIAELLRLAGVGVARPRPDCAGKASSRRHCTGVRGRSATLCLRPYIPLLRRFLVARNRKDRARHSPRADAEHDARTRERGRRRELGRASHRARRATTSEAHVMCTGAHGRVSTEQHSVGSSLASGLAGFLVRQRQPASQEREGASSLESDGPAMASEQARRRRTPDRFKCLGDVVTVGDSRDPRPERKMNHLAPTG